MKIVIELTSRVNGIPLFKAPREIILTVDDPDDVEQTVHEEGFDGDDELGQADGQTFMIEYLDASGGRSMRRITVHKLSRGGNGIVYLYCFCHERKAMRSFRVDRIKSCIDYDGVVADSVADYLEETFGLPQSAFVPPEYDIEKQSKIRTIVRHWAVLLRAVALADEKAIPIERQAAVEAMSREVERHGVLTEKSDWDWLGRYLDSLRPTGSSLRRALEAMNFREPAEKERFIHAAAAVMDADGKRRISEKALLQLFASELLGVTLTV